MELTFAEFIAGFSLPVILCLLAGIVLLVIEMFMPGFGVVGGLGILCLIGSVILRADSVAAAMWMVVMVLVIVGILLLIFLRSATKGALSKSDIILKDRLEKDQGYMSTEDMEFFIGHQGVTLTVLRPAGMADFDGVKLDVVSDGEFIPELSDVEVVRVEGRRILVKKIAKSR